MNRAIDERRVRTAPLATRGRTGRQGRLLAELDDMQYKFMAELHRAVGHWTSAKIDLTKAYAWPNSNAERIGAAIRCALTEIDAKGWGSHMAQAIRTCRKLRAAAAAGVLSPNDEELAEVRRLSRAIELESLDIAKAVRDAFAPITGG